MKYKQYGYFLAFLCLPIIACNQRHSPKQETTHTVQKFTMYSIAVKDSCYISVQLPLKYNADSARKYPVVVLTDANFYFPMLAAILHQYEKGGLLPPLILVGVGYKSFETMNALRVRDYLYPKAIPSDEMKAPGGGLNYYHFITRELLPKIDSSYRTENKKRTLLGHSFGGYFSLLALGQQLIEHHNYFDSFISASPSLWYNNNYLFQLPQQLKKMPLNDTLNVLLSAGALETPKEWTIDPVQKMNSRLKDAKIDKLKLSSVIYTDADHMDNGLISFISGLEKIYQKKAAD